MEKIVIMLIGLVGGLIVIGSFVTNVPYLHKFDKAYHVLAYTLFSFLLTTTLRYYFHIQPLYAVCLGMLSAFLLGLSLEVVQYFLPNRTFDLMDVVANGAGAMIGALMIFMFLKFFVE